jgi:hypothetical protein
LSIIVSGSRPNGINDNNSKKPGDDINHDLRSLKFKPSWWHGTVSKLQTLLAMSRKELGNITKYMQYLNFFSQLHDSCGLKSKIYTLILPPARELMEMEVDILIKNIPSIRQTFVRGNICNLFKLPDLYPSLKESSGESERIILPGE